MKTVIRNGYTPTTGEYCNTVVVDRESNKKYMFDSDGVWTDMTQPAVTTQADWATENPRDFSYIKNKPDIKGIVEEAIEESEKPYISLRRLGSYTYEITFDELPEYKPSEVALGACSSFVKDGKLYRNFDWHYDEAPTFVVKAKGFTGIANGDKLVDGNLKDEELAQLPYRIVDGYNDNGIMMSTHVLYNDWSWTGAGSIPMQKLPYTVLNKVKSMATIREDLADVLGDLAGLPGEYLLQLVITDGTTTFALLPPQSDTGAYELVDITSNPKLTNFRWVENETVERGADYMQNRPTGVERWNEMTEDMSELRFTKAYETNARLSEFIGINGTTKASPDSALQSIYDSAHSLYENRTRNGQLWQTVHSVVYSKHGMEHLYTQENWDVDYIAESSELESVLMSAMAKKQTGTLVLSLAYRDANMYIQGVTSESESNPVKGYFQGMTTTPTSIVYVVQANGVYENKSNYAYLVEVSKSNGDILKEAYLPIYHGNSIAYNKEESELYITTVVKYEDNETLEDNRVVIVDYDTFTVKETVDLPAEVTGVLSVSYDNGKTYIGCKDKVYQIEDWTTIVKTINIEENAPEINPYNNSTRLQEIKVAGNLIYRLSYDANGLDILDMSGKLVQSLYSFDTDINIRLGECESIAIEEDGTAYLSSVQVSHMRGYKERMFDRTIWKTNIFTNGYKNAYLNNLQSNDFTIYVKPSTSNHLQYGTQSYPMSNIQQAMLLAEQSPMNRVRIILQDNTNYGFIITRCNKCIEIVPSTSASVYCLYADGANLELNNITFDFTNSLDVDNLSNKNFYTQYSNIVLNTCTVTGSGSTGLITFHGKLGINYTTFNSLQYPLINKNMSEITIGNVTWGNGIVKRFVNTGSVIINYDNTQVFKNCDVTNGVLPINNTAYQYLDYTYNNNVVTVSGVPTARLANFTYKAGIHVTVDGANLYFTVPVKTGGSRYVVESANGNTLYKIIYNLSYSGTTFTLTPACYKIDVANNTISSISMTQEVTSFITEQ